MSRYVNELAINKSPEEVGGIVKGYLASEGFDLKEYTDKEKVWQKGEGWVAAPQFIRVMVRPGSVKIEAWIKFALLPGVYMSEMGLTGFFGWAMKKVLKDRVDVLEKRLQG